MIKIDEIGKISSGEYLGWQVKVVDDSKDSGGYFVLISRDFNDKRAEAYDNWIESKPKLDSYFQENKWVVEW